jgi:hypothetical protein
MVVMVVVVVAAAGEVLAAPNRSFLPCYHKTPLIWSCLSGDIIEFHRVEGTDGHP